MNRVKNRFDKVLKLMMVFMMAVTCFSDFPIRVSAETLSVDSVVNIVSDKDAASESSEQAVLTVQVKLEDQTITIQRLSRQEQCLSALQRDIRLIR